MASKAQSSPLPPVLDQLWRSLHLPSDIMDVLGELLDQTLAFLPEAGEGDADTALALSRAAHVLAETAAASSDNALVKKALQALTGMGPMGEILAASFLDAGTLQDPKLKQILLSLPGHVLLAVINRYLSRPRGEDTKQAAWAAETVHGLQGEDPEEVLVFLDALAKADEFPAFAVQRELLHGRFGFWLQELLALELDAEQAAYMAATASRLYWPPLQGKLLRLLKFARTPEIPALFGLVSPGWDDPGGRITKAALLFFKHKDPRVRLAAAGALIRLGSPQAPQALASLFARTPEARSGVLGLCPGLSAREFRLFAKALPAKERPAALAGILDVIARVDPEHVKARLGAAKGPAAKAAAELVKGRKRAELQPAYTPAPPAPPRKPKDGSPSLLGRVKRAIGGETKVEDEARSALKALGQGKDLKGAILKSGDARGLSFSKNTFTDCTLGALDFSGCAFAGVQFTGCRLADLDFSSARMKGVSFEDCTFTGCRFSGALLQEVAFSHCALTRTHLDAAPTEGLRLTACKWEQGSLWGARLEGAALASCLFRRVDFSHASLVGASLDGMEFEDCLFARVFIRDSRVANARSQGCVYRDCAVSGLSGDDPGLLRQAERSVDSLAARVAAQERPAQVPAALASEDGLLLMTAVAESWLFGRDLLRRRRRALAANLRRLEWCRAKLGPERGKVLGMLPGLVQAPALRDGGETRPAAPCVIPGYAPGYTAAKDLAAHFGESADPGGQAGVRVEAFYSIGSVGSIAQTKGSDLDMWVCFDAGATDPQQVEALRDKLAALERWAEAEHGMELHFFVMDLGKVRENNFGFSDKESAGSSQALLLKEEFYRTAVLLAGRELAWWLTPPGLSKAAYAKALERIARRQEGEMVVDLGAMTPIPREEFFGASLWQIVKALKSPFKSIMKFAVLDKYLAGGDGDALLCNRIKKCMQAGRADFWSLDPYAVLFREVEAHYAGAGNADAQTLMRMAFEQKTGYSAQARTSGRQVDMRGYSWLEYFFPYSADAQPGGPPVPGRGDGRRTFAQLHDLGQMVTRFMFSTYDSISKGVAGLEGDAHITGQDLTRLGRKIFGHFRPRPQKVMHVPFLERPGALFSGLEVLCEGRAGTARTWLVSGNPSGGGKLPPEELHREKHPVTLLVWLVANHLYTGGMTLRGANLQAPISTPDLRTLLDAVLEQFPPKAVLEPEIEETLRDEEMTRALVCVNFLADRERKELLDATLVYCTNWGELFCVTEPKGLDVLERDVMAFLQANTKAVVAPDVQLTVHYPRKSQAPRIVEI
ncbi:class I adenylate cyclase [Desulfocurvus sp. DL9XJH121]